MRGGKKSDALHFNISRVRLFAAGEPSPDAYVTSAEGQLLEGWRGTIGGDVKMRRPRVRPGEILQRAGGTSQL